MTKFKLIDNNFGRLPTNKNHLNFKWLEPDCTVLFSITRQGSGASCHFTADKNGMKKIKQAINDFCEFVFENFVWCKMILAKIQIKKVEEVVKQCSFIWTVTTKKYTLYIRKRNGFYI